MQPVASTSSLSPTKQSLIPQKRSLDTATDDGIRCKCGYKHDDGFSIGCDRCERWCHGACFGIYAGINEPEHWLCWECDPKHKGKHQHKRRKESPVIVVDDHDDEQKTYVPIVADDVPEGATREKLRAQAAAWRGVSALSPSPSHLRSMPESTSSILPPSYTLHTSSPVPPETYLSPFVSTITPSSAYLADPLNAYAHLGMPKPFVHLLGPPLDLALDTRLVGNQSRWVRSGCRPNAVLRPMLCSPSSEQLGFGLFATRALDKDEEIVLGWEWDDGNVVHHLPTLLNCPDMFKPLERDHIRKQMAGVVHALESTFAKCACGKDTKGHCAIERMKQFVDADRVEPQADLGPLVGTERGFRTQEKVPWSGGMGGVEMCTPPTPQAAPADIMPPKMRKSSLRMKGPLPNPATSPTSAFANLSLASPYASNVFTPKEEPMEIDTDMPTTPSLIFTSTTTTASPASMHSPASPPPSESCIPPAMAHKSHSPSSIPAAFSRRRNSRTGGVHWMDIELRNLDHVSPQTVPINLSSEFSDVPTPRSVSAPRSVQLDSSPNQSPVAPRVELPLDETRTPRTPLPPEPDAARQPVETPLSSDSPSVLKQSVKSPSPPPNCPNENAPPLGVVQLPPPKKLTLKDFARRKREREEKEQVQDKVMSPTCTFQAPEIEIPPVTAMKPFDHGWAAGREDLQAVVNTDVTPAQPVEVNRDPTPEHYRREVSIPSSLPLSARLSSPFPRYETNAERPRPVNLSFVAKAEDVQSLGRELAQRICQDSPAPSNMHHLPAKPLTSPRSHLHGYGRQRSHSPMGEYRMGKPMGRSRMSPQQQQHKFSPEDGEIVQPPRYPRSMNLAGPVSKPIPSGPRAMRGLR